MRPWGAVVTLPVRASASCNINWWLCIPVSSDLRGEHGIAFTSSWFWAPDQERSRGSVTLLITACGRGTVCPAFVCVCSSATPCCDQRSVVYPGPRTSGAVMPDSGREALENFPHLACTLRRSCVAACSAHAHTRSSGLVCMRGGGNSRALPSRIWHHCSGKLITGSVWCTRCGLFAIPTTSVSLLSGRRWERDGTKASERHWKRARTVRDRRRVDVLSRLRLSDATHSLLCVRARRKAFHLAPPFGQKEARNEYSELGLRSWYGPNTRSWPASR